MKIRALTVSAAILFASVATAHADSVTGIILAFDRKAQLIVLDDKTVWSLESNQAEVPADLKAGDKIEITSEGAGENGIGSVTGLKIVN